MDNAQISNEESSNSSRPATTITNLNNENDSSGPAVPPGSQSSPTGGAGGIKEFIAHTTMFGNVIAAAASQKNSSEPLPFTDYSLFEENYGNFILFIFFRHEDS